MIHVRKPLRRPNIKTTISRRAHNQRAPAIQHSSAPPQVDRPVNVVLRVRGQLYIRSGLRRRGHAHIVHPRIVPCFLNSRARRTHRIPCAVRMRRGHRDRSAAPSRCAGSSRDRHSFRRPRSGNINSVGVMIRARSRVDPQRTRIQMNRDIPRRPQIVRRCLRPVPTRRHIPDVRQVVDGKLCSRRLRNHLARRRIRRKVPAPAAARRPGPVPNSLAGTNPEIRSDFDASPTSTYCFVAAWFADAGFPGSVIGPVIVPPAVGRKIPDPTLVTEASTYALFATCPVLVGVGTLGAVENVFAPMIVSVPARCTTALSFAFVASDEFTYCSETACPATPAPGVVRTAARFAGDVVGTTQYSVLTCPGPIW